MARKSRKLIQSDNYVAIKVNPKFSAWVYARISVENSHSEDSIDNQIAICRDYINTNNELAFDGVFTDLGYSGTNFDRPGYADMMAKILCGDVKCIVVKDLSRLGRTYIEVGELLFDTFVQYGVRFISVNDDYDSFADDAGRKKLLILFKNLVNHMYSKDLGRKIRSSFATKQQKGELLGAMPPYGYMFAHNENKKYLEIEPESAEIVKLMFDLRLQGFSTIKIAEHLNANKIPTPGVHYYRLGLLKNERYNVSPLWQNSFVIKVLVNEVYIGFQVQGKYERHGKKYILKPKDDWIIHTNTHTPIIDGVQFERVQQLVSEAKNKYKKHGNPLDKNIFVGKIFCSRCGKAAKREYYRGKTETKYSYHCRYCDMELKREIKADTIKPIKSERIESLVTEFIQKQIDACLDIDNQLKNIASSAMIVDKRQKLKLEQSKCIKASTRADELLAAAYIHHLSGVLDNDEFELARVKFENDKQSASANLVRIEKNLSEYDLDEMRNNESLKNFRIYKGFNKLNKEIIDALIYRIDITPLSNDIDIILNFNDNFEKLQNMRNESEGMTDVC